MRKVSVDSDGVLLQSEHAAKPHKASGASGAGAVVRIRSAYDGSRVVVGLCCTAEEDRTQQSFKDECDINVLMKRYERTGVLPVGREMPPQYADVTAIDFESSMQRVAAVSGVFSMLDARTRARFGNDPAQMLEFIAEPGNRAEAVKLGLLSKEVVNDVSGAEKGTAGVARGGEPSAAVAGTGSVGAAVDSGTASVAAGGKAAAGGIGST